MAAQRRSKNSRRARRPVAHVYARELWHGTARLLQARGASLLLLALPFGIASALLEQSILNSYPREIGDSRLAAILSLYGSMVITYLACAAISTLALPHIDETGKGRWKPYGVKWRQVGAVLTIAAVAPIGTIAGLAAAIVPGVIIWLSWVVAAPTALWKVEGPIQALRHSARLTWGSRRSLFYVFATIQFAIFVVTSAFTLAMGHSLQSLFDDPKPLSPLEMTMAGLAETVQIVLTAAVCCVAYAKLTVAEELSVSAPQAAQRSPADDWPAIAFHGRRG
jgi:hypothetical protein